MVRGTGTSLFALGRLGAAMVALIALGTGLVFAQGSTATILGVVRDTTGALVPGVSITVKHIDTGLTRTAISGESGGFPAFSVAGHRQETNRFLINGVDWIGGNATHQFITPSGASSQLLGVEAVREYNILEHTYGAEYGKRAGGQVSIVTSSGTNQWHGDLFEYHRNSALDAKNF